MALTFQDLVHKAINDLSFRKSLQTDPVQALRAAGHQLTSEQEAALKKHDQSLKEVSKAFGGQVNHS